MSERIIDTSVFVKFWRRQCTSMGRSPTSDEARSWAEELKQLRGSRTTVSPVLIEFLAGSGNAAEAEAYRAFMGGFSILDTEGITRHDIQTARHYAERIPSNRRPRDLGDCLIRALADRFHTDVDTHDSGLPRRDSSLRRRRRNP